jgi:hypothetical protein
MSRRRGRWSRRALVALLVLFPAAGAVAYAAIPGSDGVIHGCYTTRGSGSLRVIDTSAGQHCTAAESALNWNQQGPPGPPGAQGPAGPAGTVARLDDLDGIPCRGQDGKPATVRLVYGSGLEAPVSIVCITHLVANPGPFAVDVTSGTLSTPFFGDLPLPTTGWRAAGQIDIEGKITVPDGNFTTPSVPFDVTQDAAGFTSVHVSGSASFTLVRVSGSLDPASGTARLTGDAYATVSLTATAQILGATVEIYSGTCAFGSASAPISLTMATDTGGVAYSQADGSVTLSAPFAAPSLDDCSPAVPTLYAFLLNTFAGNDRLTFSGTTTPIIKSP